MKFKKSIKIIVSILIIALVGIYSTFHIPKVKVVPEKTDGQIRIMSYNLRYGASDIGQWTSRKDELASQIMKYMPDSIGIQEGDAVWMSEEGGLPTLLKDYDCVGVGRDDGIYEGEYAAIFYLADKYDVIDQGNFWLSETMDSPSLGWDAVNKRICTWVTLQNKTTGELYTHFNTHLDHVGKEARVESVKLLLSEIEKINSPIVLTGDFNFMQDSKNYKLITNSESLVDSKFAANDSMSYGTINWFLSLNFRWLKPIDFCFVSESNIVVDTYRVDNTHTDEGEPISDHYPLIIDIRIQEE